MRHSDIHMRAGTDDPRANTEGAAMAEPITLHDAILALATEVAGNDNLTVEERTRWLDMLIIISSTASGATIDALDSMSVALTNAIAVLDTGDNDDEDEEDELGDDFGDEDL